MKKVSGVIFDMDGLILDTEAIYSACNIEVAPDFGLDGYDLDKYREEIGLSETHAFEKYLADYPHLPKEAIEGFFNAGREKVLATFAKEGAPKKTGIVELLTYLNEHNIPCVVASSNNRQAVDHLITKANLQDYFKGTISGDDVTHAKPHPEIVEKAVAKLGTHPEETLMLEDSLNGIRASFTAGVPVIMVPDLLPPNEEAIEKSESIQKDLFDVLAFIQSV